KRLEFVGACLDGKPYIAADRFTAADISVSYIVTGAKFAGIEADIPAPVRAYVDNLWQRPAFQRAAAVKWLRHEQQAARRLARLEIAVRLRGVGQRVARRRRSFQGARCEHRTHGRRRA